VFLNGTLFDPALGLERTPLFPNVPLRNETEDTVQISMSSESANSFFYTLSKGGVLTSSLHRGDLPSDIPFNLTTTFLNGLFHGLTQKYG